MLGRCAGLAPRRHPKSDKVGAHIDVAKEPGDGSAARSGRPIILRFESAATSAP